MSSEWPDLALLVQAAGQRVLGESAHFTPLVGAPLDVRVLFNSAHEEITLEDGVAVSSVRPVAQAHMLDFPQRPSQGDGIQVRGVDYTVIDVRPDGEGDVQLILHEA